MINIASSGDGSRRNEVGGGNCFPEERPFQEAIVGIMGGMGPEATVALFSRIVAKTPAARDQDHLHVLIDNNPHVPDRTAAILGTGPDPLEALLTSAHRLENAGATVLVMPCNTGHHWLPALRRATTTPFLDMIEETSSEICKTARPGLATGLLATSGTIRSGLYQRALAERHCDILLPLPENQPLVMDAIYRIKAGDLAVGDILRSVSQRLFDRGARGLILGCTELSVVAHEITAVIPCFDPLSILAERVVVYARSGQCARAPWREIHMVDGHSC